MWERPPRSYDDYSSLFIILLWRPAIIFKTDMEEGDSNYDEEEYPEEGSNRSYSQGYTENEGSGQSGSNMSASESCNHRSMQLLTSLSCKLGAGSGPTP